MKKKTPVKKGEWIAALSLYGIFCAVSLVAQLLFFSRYSYASLLRNDTALMFFVIVVAVEIFKALAFLFIGFCTVRSLLRVVVSHTGYVMSQHLHAEAIARHVESVQKELRRYVWWMLAAMIAYAVSDVAYEILAVNFGVMGTINVIFGLIWIATLWKAQSEIVFAVKTKYMLE